MHHQIEIPSHLRRHCGGRSRIELTGDSVGQLLADLRSTLPELARRVLDDTGALRSHLVVLHNDQVLPRNRVGETPVEPGDELRLFTAASGG